jgi:hypothetical protein
MQNIRKKNRVLILSGRRDSNPLPTAWDPPAGGLPGELLHLIRLKKMSGRRDSNPLPTAWEAVALPGELLPLLLFFLQNRYLQLGSRLRRDYQVSYFRIYAKVKFLINCSKILFH